MSTVTFLLGSKVDTDFAKKIATMLDEYQVSSEIIEKLNARTEPTVVVTCAGMSNRLGGVVTGSYVHPVVNCPPYADL